MAPDKSLTPRPSGGESVFSLSYPWGEKQHINILESVAFLIYFRTCCSSIQFHSKRAFHIFDSRVCSCAIAKGRSSSKVLNRPLRRYCAFV